MEIARLVKIVSKIQSVQWQQIDDFLVRQADKFFDTAGVAKWLRQRLVVPPFGGSNPLARPFALK